jgi:hypothetical protein
MTELRECPFCGAEPFDHAIGPHTHSPFLKSLGIPDHGGSHVVECGCGAGFVDDTREAVVARWNRRAAEGECREHGSRYTKGCKSCVRAVVSAMNHIADSDPRYTVTPAGKAALRGES